MNINKCGCGGEAKLVRLRNSNTYRIHCKNCDMTVFPNTDINYLVATWNKVNITMSDMMQVIKWLEDGHKITTMEESEIAYVYLKDNVFYAHLQDGLTQIEYMDTIRPTNNKILKCLFTYKWRLYYGDKMSSCDLST